MVFEPVPARDLERAHQANAALRHKQGRALLTVRARATFCPLHDSTLVPVFPCAACLDGGLRAVGTVRSKQGMQRAHICDTCGKLQLYDLPEGALP
jgi:hypothetical protein